MVSMVIAVKIYKQNWKSQKKSSNKKQSLTSSGDEALGQPE